MKSFCLFLLFSFSLSLSLFSQKMGDIQWTQSFLTEEDGTPDDRLTFGYLTVPENYERAEEKLQKMAFVIIKAQVQPAEKDAVISFSGGWGERGISNLEYYKNNFLSYRRDLIIFDYRGSGYSQPKLCPDLGEKVYQHVLADYSYQEFTEKQKQLLGNCVEDMLDLGIDIHQYGTDTKARDAILLAEKLGYESYNLFGVSYGTKCILQYLRQSSEKIRAVILDSNCPLDYPINSAMISDYASSFRKIVSACKTDNKCGTKYPRLEENYLKFLNSLENKPLKVKLPKDEVIYLNRQEMNGVVHQLLYLENYYAYLPKIIHKFSHRNKLYLKRIIRDIPEVLKANYNGLGLINYVYDHKTLKEASFVNYQESLQAHPQFELFDGYLAYFHEEKDFKEVAPAYMHAKTNVPALILAGKFDPITPTYYSERILPFFDQKHYYEFPFTGHGVSNNYCGRTLADSFLQSPLDFEKPRCLDWIKEEKIRFR